MGGGEAGGSGSRGGPVPGLRAARWARNWTLQDVVEQIDARSPGGASGVTASLVSAWELGKIRTSARYRRVLCAVYGQGPEALFAHQDDAAARDPGPAAVERDLGALRVLVGYRALLAGMVEVVHDAQEQLVVTGSRSRSAAYLESIEAALAARPGLVHYRVLYGPPRHSELVRHLERLLEIRDPADRSMGCKTLHLGIVADTARTPERFFVASERDAVAIIPSVSTAESFDTGILLGKEAAAGLLAHGREAYAGARRVESIEAIRELAVAK
jgi:transcriptional regulator with XRE-family HTH domain